METHYYLSVYPLEALIASQLEPKEFGPYMALGRVRGSNERIMFVEVEGEFGHDFDWDYVRRRCVAHEDGSPKHSVWVSVYRVLEHVPLERMQSLYLTTQDGRTISISPETYDQPDTSKCCHIYQELAPVQPLVVSRLDPGRFAAYMTDPSNKVSVPKVVFADLKVPDIEHYENSGNIGAAYDQNLEHLQQCIDTVTSREDKPNKNVERSLRSFSYQVINRGVYIGDGSELKQYRMPTLKELELAHHDWARSAMLV